MASTKSNKRAKDYLNLAEQAAKGDYSALIDPLDFKIMELLPDEGEMFAGLYPIGKTIKDMARELPGLEETIAIARLRTLKEMGLVLKAVTPRRHISAYQVTKKGKEVYEEWLRQQ